MKDVAIFKKVSQKQFGETIRTMYPNFEFDTKTMDTMYNNVKIPTRATNGSVGYDFVTPFPFTLYPGTKVWIPTGIRVEILKEDWCLAIVPKSRTAKHSIRISNTIGIVDTDYYFADNEGHILIVLEMPDESKNALSNQRACFGQNMLNFTTPVEFKAGDGIGQGLFLECGIAIGENTSQMKRRTGGYGSTGN